MIKENINMTNIDGDEETYTLYFHLTRGDFMDMVGTKDAEKIQSFSDFVKNADSDKLGEHANDISDIIKILIKRAYGRRITDADGTHPRFERDSDETKRFMNSDVCSELIYQMTTDPDRFNDFVTGLIPKNLPQNADLEKAKAANAELSAKVEAPAKPMSASDLVSSLTPEQIEMIRNNTTNQKND